MEYRQNPVTKEWVLVSGQMETSGNLQSKFYDSYPVSDLFSDPATITDGIDPEIGRMTPAQLYEFFTHYRTWAQDTRRRFSNTTYIHSILKPNALKTGHFQPSQMYMAPAEDKFIDKSILNAHAFYKKHGKCLWCSMIAQESADKIRMVEQNNTFSAFVSFFARFPFETFIIPNDHCPQFSDISDVQLFDLSSVCASLFARIEQVTCGTNFSLHVHNIFVPESYFASTHWYMQVIPWVNNWAGFEIATAMYINVRTPEHCAQELIAHKANLH